MQWCKTVYGMLGLLALTCAVRADETTSGTSALPPSVTTQSAVRVWVDQIGYRPAGKKILIVASDNKLPDGLQLDLCDAATSNVVWKLSEHTDALTLFNNGEKDRESGDFISHLNLSAFKTPGRYYISIHAGDAPVERSYQFNIATDVYNNSGVAAWRMFYYNRCDIEKPEKYAGPWNAGLDHCGPGQAGEAREYVWTRGAWTDRVGTVVADPTPRDVRGGWWDAGDTNKYMGNTSECHNDLLLATQLLGNSIKDNQLNLPESGNGIPDALDEVRYGTQLLLRMADETGAAYGRVHEDGTCPPDLDKHEVQLTARTSAATMNRAASLAYAALVWKERKLDPKFAKQCQAEALKSWQLLQAKPYPWPVDPKNPKKEAYTGAWFMSDFGRSQFLAAVCLWRLTGDEAFHKQVHDFQGAMNGDRTLWGAYWIYIHAPKADPDLAAKMKAQLTKAADDAVGRTAENRGYAAGLNGYWWGSNRAIGQSGLACIVAAELSEDAAAKQKYLDAAEEFIHYLHGRNPLGLCYLTNMKQFGAEHSAMVMFHTWFGNANRANTPEGGKYIGEGPGKIGPPPGFVVGGANRGMKVYSNSLDWRQRPWEWNEPDITYQSPCCGLLGYFAWKVK